MFIAFTALGLGVTAVAVVCGLFLFVAHAGAPNAVSRPRHFVWAAVVAPLFVTFVSTQLAYSTGNFPWVSPIAHAGLVIGVLGGLALFSAVGFRSWAARLGATCGYLVVMSAACVGVGVFTACGNGDCL
jgi:hypothetical protein